MGQKKEIMRPLESFFVKQIGTTYNLAIMEIMNSKNVFAFQLLKAAILSWFTLKLLSTL